MGISKALISSPIEAGKSLLDINQLPVDVIKALDYTSSRLARKRVNLTMIVVRKDSFLQSPATSPQFASPLVSSRSSSPMSSPASSIFSGASSCSDTSSIRNMTPSPSPSFSRTKWPSLPLTPRPSPQSPRSPTWSIASSTYSISTQLARNQWGISLMPTCPLSEREEKHLRQTIAKAERKFPIGSGWLSSSLLSKQPTCTITNDIIRRSLMQNDVVYSSEGITLLCLDHLYLFKSTLEVYSRCMSSPTTPTPDRPMTSETYALEEAVDALRRLVLCQHGRRISQSYIQRCYEHLSAPLCAIEEVNEAYKLSYGGPLRQSGIALTIEPRPIVPFSPPTLMTSMTEARNLVRPKPERPALALNVNVVTRVQVGSTDLAASEAGSLGDGIQRLDRGPHWRGPMTPNGHEDITPVTRGEWGFLMVGEGWTGGKRAVVETC